MQENTDSDHFCFITSATISETVYPELRATQRLSYTSTDFTIWEEKLSVGLLDNDVDYVLTTPKPLEPTDSTPEEDANCHKKWLADDFTCCHLILGTMEDHLYLTFYDHPTAKDLMDALNACFKSHSMAHHMVLLRKYLHHRMFEDMPIFQHILKMGAMAFELELAGIPIPNEMQAVVLMNSLPESWEDMVGVLIVRMDIDKEGLTLDNVSQRLRFAGEMRH